MISSTIIQVLPLTSPMINHYLRLTRFWSSLSTIANPTFKIFPSALALSVPPTSGATQIIFLLLIFFFICLAKIGVEKRLSTGISKKIEFDLHVNQL